MSVRKDYIEVVWEVDDGYARFGSNTLVTLVPREEYESCANEKEREELLQELVKKDFDCEVTFNITEVIE